MFYIIYHINVSNSGNQFIREFKVNNKDRF